MADINATAPWAYCPYSCALLHMLHVGATYHSSWHCQSSKFNEQKEFPKIQFALTSKVFATAAQTKSNTDHPEPLHNQRSWGYLTWKAWT
jgi:hypothetical protein